MNIDINTEPHTTYHGDRTELLGQFFNDDTEGMVVVEYVFYDALLNVTDVYVRPVTPEEADA